MIRKISLLCVVALSSLSIYAQQDAQYTQYMYNTVNVNPAYAGTRNTLSIFGLYRTQWVGMEGAPDTGAFSVHTPAGERLGLGLSMVHDKIGISNETGISADVSYTIPVTEKYNLSYGMKATAHLLNVDYTRLNMNDGNDYIFTDNIENRFSPNIGVGLYLYSDKFYIGASVPYLLETKHYKVDNNTHTVASERMNGYLITGYVFDLTDNIKFKPAALAKVVKGAPLQVDITGNFLFNERFTLGVAWRWSAAVSGLAGFQINRSWFIGYGYDAETTRLSNYNSGSHEIFLRYEFYNRPTKVISPRFF